MFDRGLSQRSSDDTVVIDISDDELLREAVPHITTPSTDGRRHKLLADRSLTSCGQQWTARVDVIEREETWMAAAGALCPECFSTYERTKAEQAFVADRRRITGEQAPLNVKEWTDLPSRKPRKKK